MTETIEVYRCVGCGEEVEEGDVAEEPLYECGNCSTTFLGTEGNRCPQCNKFAARVELEFGIGACPSCEEAEVEPFKTTTSEQIEADRLAREREREAERIAKAMKPEVEIVRGDRLVEGDVVVAPVYAWGDRDHDRPPQEWHRTVLFNPRPGDGSPFGGKVDEIVADSSPTGSYKIIVPKVSYVEILRRDSDEAKRLYAERQERGY